MARSFRMDLSLAREGISLGVRFGGRSLLAMARIAAYVEDGIYEPGSLSANGRIWSLTLRNPPLRLGAFSRITLALDGEVIAPAAISVRTSREGPVRSAAGITPEAPLELLPGRPLEIVVDGPAILPGEEHRVRLEFYNVAIPPRAWIEIRDRVSGGGPA